MRASTPTLLSLNGGYVDTVGFLSLHGLFTAHVTGNFASSAAAIVNGSSGVIAKLLSVPVFCLVVGVMRSLSYELTRRKVPVVRTLLLLEIALLTGGAALALKFGPFEAGDGRWALITAVTLISAMAIQTIIQRVYFPMAPATTVQTTSSAQIMIDLADLVHGPNTDVSYGVHSNLLKMSISVAAFATGCVLAGLAYGTGGATALLAPPLIALGCLIHQNRTGFPES